METERGFLSQEIKKVERDYGESSLSVEEVLKIPTFKGYRVIGGHQGLKNRCMHLTILETPEGIEWLKGGEFLLTTGYALKDNKNALKNVMFRAHRQKASAIAIKERRYIDIIPQEMIDQANEYGVPLILLPYDLVYTAAVSSFYEGLFYKKNEYLLQAKSMHERLLNMVFESKDMKGAVEALSTITNSSIIVYDSVFNLLSWNLWSSQHKEISDMIMKGSGHVKDTCWLMEQGPDISYGGYYISFYTLLSKNKTIGYMYIVSDSVQNNLKRTAINHGRMILSLKMAKEDNESLSKIGIKKSIVNIILNSQVLPEEFYFNVSNNNGWDGKDKFIGISIRIYDGSSENENISDFKEQIYSLLSRIFREEGFLVFESPDQIFVFYCVESTESIEDLINKITLFSRNYNEIIKLSFGISSTYSQVRDIPKMYKECYISSLFNKEGEVLYYDSLNTIKLFYSLKDDKQVLEQYNKTISKIEEYDQKNRGDLLDTLEAYFKYNMNKRKVSDKLHIHLETLRYRLNKIESLTGYSLHTAEGNFILLMNLKLHKIYKMQ